jgi:hypothetical protein
MGKPRRPRASRSTWEPKPPQEADAPAPAENHAENSAIETAAVPAVAAGTPAAALDPPPAIELIPEIAEPQVAPAVGPDLEMLEATAAAIPEATAADETAAVIVRAPAVAPEASGIAAPNRIAFSPDRLDVVEIGSTIARYVRGEGEAALAHLRALSGARTPADLIRLQVGEVQRAADASLTCWVTVVGKASRVVAFR